MHLSQYARSFLGPDRPRTALPFLLISMLVLIGGVYHAAVLRWLSDDIFITFRYIEQWFNGNGLVYNPGERVEGYTHPLWLLLLSGWRLLGFDMISGSLLFGIVAQGLLLATLIYASWRLGGRPLLAVPAAAAAVALHHDAAVWATSGLETGFYSFLLTLAVVFLTVPRIDERSRMLLTGSALVLATLTRPDGALVLITMGMVVAIRAWAGGSGTGGIKERLLHFALPSAVFIPYALWKFVYYGDLLPNTYYAKSGGGAHFEQGFTYISLFVQGYPSTVFIIAASIALLVAFRRSGSMRSWATTIFSDPRLSVSAVCLLVSVVYTVGFVARVGGDFMYARFLIPIVPLIYLSAESGTRYVIGERPKLVWMILILVPLTVGTADVRSRASLFRNAEHAELLSDDGDKGIIDEHRFWTKPFTSDDHNAIALLRGVGTKLRGYFDGLTVRILIRGQASLAYESKATEVIENWGLTDAYIAHLEIEGRGRVGHEKAAPMEYVVARRVHFFFFKDFTPSDTSYYRIATFDLPYEWGAAEMHFYDRDLMRELKRRYPDAISFVDFERYLDDYLKDTASRSRNEMERDFDRFKSYYFIHNYDPEREKKFLEVLRQKRDG